MTSWAVIALADVVGVEHPAVKRGAAWLARNQSVVGSYPREAVNGVFFGTAMLDYELYRAYFPAWCTRARRAVGRNLLSLNCGSFRAFETFPTCRGGCLHQAAEHFGHAPRLCDATPRSVGRLSVEDFTDRTDTRLAHVPAEAIEERGTASHGLPD